MNKLIKKLFLIVVVANLTLGCGLIPVVDEVLTPLVLYVSVSGNDANDCLSEVTACLTLQAAMEKSTLNSTINIGPGHFYISGPAMPVDPVYDLINGVTVIGAGADQTILHSNKFVFTLEASSAIPVVLRDLGIDASGGAEGGLHVRARGDVSIENCHFYNGKVGVLVEGNGIARIKNSTFDTNQIGVRISGGSAQVWNDSVVSGNNTGISIDSGGSADIMRIVIENNEIGIINNGELYLVSTTLRHNTAKALENDNQGRAVVSSSTFDSNGYGEVMPSDGHRSADATLTNRGEISITNSTFSNNYGIGIVNETVHTPQNDSSGNPIYTYEMTLDEVQVINNGNAHLSPCAIVNKRGFIRVDHSNIEDNDCMGVDLYGGESLITQSSIINNKVGIFVRGGSSATVTNSTIGLNYWFGIEQVDDGYIKLIGVTVASNRGVQISASNPDTGLLMLDTVVVGGICSINITPTAFTCNNSNTVTTLGLDRLTEAEGTQFHPLLPGSALIDAGDSCMLDTDQRGHIRPTGGAGGCDVGAYEREPSTAIAPLEFATPASGVPGVVPLYTETPQGTTPIILTFTNSAFCRKGPGSLYRIITGFVKGDSAQADGRNDVDPRWWWVLIPNSTQHCWVSYVNVDPIDLAEDLPIQPTTNLTLPAAPSEFIISKRNCSANGYSLQLSWKTSSGADGYTLYRNGEEISTFTAAQTSFQETPPLDTSLIYELEAFNGNGFSKRLVVEDHCP